MTIVTSVRGPFGQEIRHVDLPQGGKFPRTVEDRELLVYAICGGLLSLAEAEDLYGIKPADFASWQKELEESVVPQSVFDVVH